MDISRWRLAAYAVVILLGCALALPNVLPRPVLDRIPEWYSEQRVQLGLDLRGGASLVLEIDDRALRQEQLERASEAVLQALDEQGLSKAEARLKDGFIDIQLPTPGDRQLIAAIEDAAPVVSPGPLSGSLPLYQVENTGPQSIRIALGEDAVRAARSAALDQSLEIIRTRIDEFGVAEPSIQRLGASRILVQLPGVNDPGAIRTLLGSTAKMSFHLTAPARKGIQTPRGYLRLPGVDGHTYVVEQKSLLQGDSLKDAWAGFDSTTGEPVVQFRLDRQGAEQFGSITRKHVGEPFAIVLDRRVLSAPVIREPITGGSGQISGSFTTPEAGVLASLLRAGALPVPLEVVEERTVGPDLGQEAIDRGTLAGLAGFGLVFAAMMALYGVWGLVANLALLLNVTLTFAALALLGATLTLPGIAGIILGVGLAVDANVLINERIREETRRGRSAGRALVTGFDRAYRAIVDSNLTTLIATALLFWLGSGPVKGFAVTMGLGIGISMFTSVAVVRAVMVSYVRRYRPRHLVIRPAVRIFRREAVPDFRFMRARFLGLAVSLVLSLASVALVVQPGLNLGIDFRGGVLVEAETPAPFDLPRLRDSLERLGVGDVSLQTAGAGDRILVRLERQPGGEPAQIAAAERVKAAVAAAIPGAEFERVEIVGPRVSSDLALGGLLATGLACLAMLLYVWARFDWPFAVGAIATLLLDVTKTLGFFALTRIEFNLAAVAALLTLIGYSVNDKVVVYDRMRENMRSYKHMPLRELIDLSINQTLGRSLYTSLTALIAMLPLALWGGSAVKSFAVPMVFGIVVAASSSVFIAAPILLFLGDWRAHHLSGSETESAP